MVRVPSHAHTGASSKESQVPQGYGSWKQEGLEVAQLLDIEVVDGVHLVHVVRGLAHHRDRLAQDCRDPLGERGEPDEGALGARSEVRDLCELLAACASTSRLAKANS